MNLIEIEEGLVFSPDNLCLYYDNSFIIKSGETVSEISERLGLYSEYISDDDRDILYAKCKGIQTYSGNKKEMDTRLMLNIELTDKIQELIETKYKENPNIDVDLAIDEFNHLVKNKHNTILLKIAFILKEWLDNRSNGVYIMRGSGIASYLMYLLGLNKVNPIKFNLDYKNFWK